MTDVRAIDGALMGGAVADALGLPREGLSRQRARRLFGEPPFEHALLARRGIVSDDTDHHCVTAYALTKTRDADGFERALARGLKRWLFCVPVAIGSATLRALIRLSLGVSPLRSGVFSAGNGPAMRAPIVGVVHASDDRTLLEYVRAVTRLTHTDPRALQGAWVIAYAAAWAARKDVHDREMLTFWSRVFEVVEAPDLRAMFEAVRDAHRVDRDLTALADDLGLARGVTGFMNHTAPMAIAVWLRHPEDYAAAVTTTIALGGDTDSVAAVVGALVGARVGRDGIPKRWRTRTWAWPLGPDWTRRCAEHLVDPTQSRPRVLWPALALRNLVLLMIVMAHGFRRLLPPY